MGFTGRNGTKKLHLKTDEAHKTPKMRRGKGSAQASLNQALEDLLGGDVEEPTNSRVKNSAKNAAGSNKAKSDARQKKSLTSREHDSSTEGGFSDDPWIPQAQSLPNRPETQHRPGSIAISYHMPPDPLRMPMADSAEIEPKTKGQADRRSSEKPHPIKLIASSSSKDFYSNLSAIAGHDIAEDNSDQEDVEVTSEDAAQLAKSLGDMDDLESDLFGSFGGKKNPTKSKGSSISTSKSKKKAQDFADFDEDDPLAGLGLSDDDDDVLTNAKKLKSKKPELTRKLSHTSSKGKVDPNLGNSGSSLPDTSPARSTSFDKDDPFLATDPRPRSGSMEWKMKRLNSWEEPSIGTQSASESELTPRTKSGSSSQIKHNRRGSTSKKKITPTPSNEDSSAAKIQGTSLTSGDTIDVPDSGIQDKRSPKHNKEPDDIFADEDDLPGLSDDEIGSPKKRPTRRKTEDTEPVRKATSALDDLLGGKTKNAESKGRKPTFLEQMMTKSGGTSSSAGDLPIETESPITSPREKDIRFGSYSPSAGTTKDRPTTAPNRRSVRFADELGFDELDMSFPDSTSRPSTAPESGRSKKTSVMKSKDTSLEDDNTDFSLNLSTGDFKKKPTSKEATPKHKQKETEKSAKTDGNDWLGLKEEGNADDSKDDTDAPGNSPRRKGKLQNSRRKQASFGETKESSKEDWLGLGDEAVLMTSSENPAAKPDLKDTGKTNSKGITRQHSQDEWLGLGEEVFDSPKNIEATKTSTKNVDLEKQRGTEENSSPKKQTRSKADPPSDELFPWETPDGSSRQRRRQNNRNSNESSIQKTVDIFSDSTFGEEDRKNSTGVPVSHSTPVGSSGTTEERNETRKTPVVVAASQHQLQDQQQAMSIPQPSNIAASQQLQSQTLNQGQEQQILASHSKNLHTQQIAYSQGQPQTGTVTSPYGMDHTSQTNVQGQLLTQILAEQGQFPMQGNQFGFQDPNAMQRSIQGFNASGRWEDTSLLAMQMEKLNAEKVIQQHKIEEYETTKTQHEKDRLSLETELRDLQLKISSFEEGKLKSNLESTNRIEELENKIRKLEFEKEQLVNSQEMLKKRHEDEIKAMENSHKTRFQILEDTYKRRETQLKEEHEFANNQFNERIKAFENEKTEIISSNKRRIEMIEKNKETDLERIKLLHKKAMEDLSKDCEDQLERLRVLKEQEVAAATSMFSQTKSLQSLIQQVQNSTSEVEQLQKRIDSSHKDSLTDRENSLRVRDEYLKTMQERLHRQESENIEERSRLHGLIAKLEMQLREQSRQLEQDRWKITQDESRLKSLQIAVDDERQYTMQQLNNERQMIEKSRDDLMNEQRRIMGECYEERRKLTIEKQELQSSQSKFNKDNLEREYNALKERELKIVSEEQRLDRERNTIEKSFNIVNEEKHKLEEFARQIQIKSKEVEELSKEASRVQQEGLKALEYSQSLKVEVSNASSVLESRAASLDQQERALSEERTSLEIAKKQFEIEKGNQKCHNCQQILSSRNFQGSQYQEKQYPIGVNQNPPIHKQQEQASSSSPAPSSTSSDNTITSNSSARQIEDGGQFSQTRFLAPDIVLDSLNFNRTLRKWTSDKEQDEEFFEEESRYLDKIQNRRDLKITGR